MPKIIEDATIYQAVRETVIKYGYEGATTKRLAKMAGVGEVTLFRKYGNKAQLVKQAMLAAADQANFEATVDYTGDLRADLLVLANELNKAFTQNGRFFYTLLIESSRHPDLKEALVLFQARFRATAMLILRYQTEGALKQGHPLHLVSQLVGPLMAINIADQMGGEIISIPPMDLTHLVNNFLTLYSAT